MTKVHDGLHQFIVDEQIRKFKYEECHDLINPDSGVEIAPDTFEFTSFAPEKGQVVVVKAVAPYLMRRENPGTPDESVVMVSRFEANRWFSVTIKIGNSIPLISSINVNAFADLATASDSERIEAAGGTGITDDPWLVEFLPKDPADSYLVRSQKKFSLTLKQLPLNTVDPISNPVIIGGPTTKRVDFAGAIVYGVTMPESVYDSMKKRWKADQ